MRYPRWLAIVPLVLTSGCDSRAQASDPPKVVRQSKELESCSSAEDCEGELRCLDLVCRRTQRSAVGDYYAALGATQRAHGDLEGAVAAYTEALGHYDTEKVKLPSEIDCAYGGTLAAARDVKKEYAERGAKVLHRCVLAVPVGGALRSQAMLDLATLGDSGLDPLALGRAQVSDVYLTKGVAKPPPAPVTVTVADSPTLPDKVGSAVRAKLDEQKPALMTCWQTFTGTSKKDALVVTIGVRQAYYKNPDFEDDPSAGSLSLKLEAPGGSLSGADAGADACVRPVLEAAIKAAPRETFTSKITITIK
ncbi:MAG: hypothetical protein NT062_02925 [Proteobacteria bacterium]|nr:hypothetical protein [Pseudomonadota bacterium]